MSIAWQYAARTDIGLVRSRNEDSGYAGPHLLAIADGMGGHAGGNVASSLVIARLAPLDGDSHGCDDALELLADTVAEANAAISRAVEEDDQLRGMGTTLTGLMRCGNTNLVLVHIGDSRAYMLRDGNFSQITTDHSFVQSLVEAGRISPEDAENHPQRSLVTRVLTGANEDEPDLSVRQARIGDRYLICSDGLSDYVGRETIEEVVRAGDTPAAALRRLVDLSLKAGAPDNVTAVVADIVDSDSNAPTHPVVVGAAAERVAAASSEPTQALTPAQKAAALANEVKTAAGGGAAETDDDPDASVLAGLADNERRVNMRSMGVALLVVATLLAGVFGAYRWSQQQHYVSEYDGKVAVFRGVPQSFGPVQLSSLERTVDDISVGNLPDFYRNRLRQTIPAASEADVENQIATLRVQQAECLSRISAGAPCGSGTSTEPTTTPAEVPGSTETQAPESTATTPPGPLQATPSVAEVTP